MRLYTAAKLDTMDGDKIHLDAGEPLTHNGEPVGIEDLPRILADPTAVVKMQSEWVSNGTDITGQAVTETLCKCEVSIYARAVVTCGLLYEEV